jgi:hypothetical protein
MTTNSAMASVPKASWTVARLVTHAVLLQL